MKGKPSDWKAWDIKKFEKYDDRDLTAFKLSEDVISEEFKALYEKVEITEKDGFRRLYLGEVIADTPDRTFTPAQISMDEGIYIDETEEIVDPETEDVPEKMEFDEGEEAVSPEDMDEEIPPDEIEREPKPEPPEAFAPPAGPDPEELESIREEAYAEGFQKGEADGKAATENMVMEKVGQLEGILSEIENAWQQMVVSYEEQLLSLVCKISEKVVLGHVAIDNEVVKKSIIEAFRILPEPEMITIHLNSEDYQYIEVAKEDIFKNAKQLKQISLISDPSINPGGCLIESEKGGIDATLESRLEAVKKSIIEAGKTT